MILLLPSAQFPDSEKESTRLLFQLVVCFLLLTPLVWRAVESHAKTKIKIQWGKWGGGHWFVTCSCMVGWLL